MDFTSTSLRAAMQQARIEKRKAKRKAKQKERRLKTERSSLKEKAAFHFAQAGWLHESGLLAAALSEVEKATRLDPANPQYLEGLFRIAQQVHNTDLEFESLHSLYRLGLRQGDNTVYLAHLLMARGRFEEASKVIEESLSLAMTVPAQRRKNWKQTVLALRKSCQSALENPSAKPEPLRAPAGKPEQGAPDLAAASAKVAPEKPQLAPQPKTTQVPEIPLSLFFDPKPLEGVLSAGSFSPFDHYQLTALAHQIHFRSTFDQLICLKTIRNIQSFAHQEETARKVLKTFRGRAILADEVGLGKTIEALMVLKEYILRGMVRNALILTPPALLSQWQEELSSKFELDFVSTDDPAYRSAPERFWNHPFILAAITQAKTTKSYPFVIAREWEMVVVDEAHRIKNRNTLNWKLVNALKKRFLLLLTATPVENHLMELYNLVTLLRPGQLKTPKEFRAQFMKRGDPTDPQNRQMLKELLGEVMIRNTRALANINIPPRFAQTHRIEPTSPETQLFERLHSLVRDMNADDGRGLKIVRRSLLEEAGSSPRALISTLAGILERGSLHLRHEQEIRALLAICRSLDQSAKNAFLLHLLRSSEAKSIVFVKFLGTLEHIREFLERQGVLYALFHGRMDNQEKDRQIARFQEEAQVLIATEVGGEGRNLQFCHQMVNYDLPWNPMKIEQRIGRIHRIGQERETIIHNLCTRGSVEEHILEILDRKINMFELVIGEIDMILGRIEDEQEFSDTAFEIFVKAADTAEADEAFAKFGARILRAKKAYLKTKELDARLFGENYEL